MRYLLSALAVLFLCNALHADDIAYTFNYNDTTQLGSFPSGPQVSDIWQIFGTLEGFDNENATLLNILGIPTGLTDEYESLAPACQDVTVPCDDFREVYNYQTDLPSGIDNTGSVTIDPPSVSETPEPSAWLLFGTGAIALWFARKKLIASSQ